MLLPTSLMFFPWLAIAIPKKSDGPSRKNDCPLACTAACSSYTRRLEPRTLAARQNSRRDIESIGVGVAHRGQMIQVEHGGQRDIGVVLRELAEFGLRRLGCRHPRNGILALRNLSEILLCPGHRIRTIEVADNHDSSVVGNVIRVKELLHIRRGCLIQILHTADGGVLVWIFLKLHTP